MVVMYVGVVPETSRLLRQMKPICGRLSVTACFLYFGHVLAYVSVYAARLFDGAAMDRSVATVYALDGSRCLSASLL